MRPSHVLLVVFLGGLAGCGGDSRKPITLRPDAFFRDSTLQQPESSRRTAIDQPGQLNYDNVRVDIFNPPQDEQPGQEPVTAMSPEARQLVASPRSTTAPVDASRPSLPPLGAGQAVAIGKVVCEVNGAPVFSRKVLQPIEAALAADARGNDPETFRKLASKTIRDQVDFLIRTELEVAAAKKNLTSQELQIADQATMVWRAKQITDAGGSLELAKQRAIAQGTTFEELIEDEYRANIVRLHYQKRLLPRVQVTADEMRRYYDRYKDEKFTSRAQARFRLIKVDIKKIGDRATARAKAEELLARARGGEDFDTLAREYNDDPRYRANGGDQGMIDKGAFALTAVENAVWARNPGEVTDIVEERNAFYIGKLEQKTEARVRSFDEEAVQDEIRNTLRGQQLQELRDKQRDQLLQGAVVNPYPPRIEPLLEIVMQRYPYWAMK